VLGASGAIGAALALWLMLGDDAPSSESPARGALPPFEREAGASASPSTGAVAGDAVPRVAPGGTLEIAAASLSAESPLVVRLELPGPSSGDAKLPVRILTEGGAPLHLEATASAGEGARLEVPPGALMPGRYLIEMKTQERSPLPLRRYVLIVR